MSKTRLILEEVTGEQPVAARPQISPEDQAILDKIKRDRAYVAGWSGGDDHPFQGPDGYSGYTVTDARNHMTRIKQAIEDKYGITHTPSPAAMAREQAKFKAKQDTRASVDKQVAEKFPLLSYAMSALWYQQDLQRYRTPRYGWRNEPDARELQKMRANRQRAQAKVTRALAKGGFKNISAAAAYRTQANKLKDQLLVKAGIRKRW